MSHNQINVINGPNMPTSIQWLTLESEVLDCSCDAYEYQIWLAGITENEMPPQVFISYRVFVGIFKQMKISIIQSMYANILYNYMCDTEWCVETLQYLIFL